MSKKVLSYLAILALLVLSVSLSGCGSSGGSSGLSYVDDSKCMTCHSSWTESLSGRPIVTDFTSSIHYSSGVTCQDCHGPGSQHAVSAVQGSIPYPVPGAAQCEKCHADESTKWLASKHNNVDASEITTSCLNVPCMQCHTQTGAVLTSVGSAVNNLPQGTLDPLRCDTCHLTHHVGDASGVTLRVPVNWNPSTTVDGKAAPGNTTTNTSD
ncbi:MAG: hypothetical protein FWD70_07485, partial [Desulfuromonadales bacterium]|nr:hypothetical protein [Desulfuromonadales bacterium]